MNAEASSRKHAPASKDVMNLLQRSLWISSPEYAGWLVKRTNNWLMNQSFLFRDRAWQRKWVSLTGMELIYMDNEPTFITAETFKIRRANITAYTVINENCPEHNDPTTFSLTFYTDSGDSIPLEWHFKAETVEEKQNWIIKLTQVHAIVEWLEQYEKVKVLGLGAQGIVYELKHKVTGRRLALKEIGIKDDKQMSMAIAEAQFLKNIVDNVSHPNIIQIEKVFQVGSKFYLVFPLCTGGELHKAVIARGHFTEYDAAVIVHDVVSALHALHEHDILHLDIKPENILFETNDPDSKVMLTDFGLSKLFSEVQKDADSSRPFQEVYKEKRELFAKTGQFGYDGPLRGTNGYLSPELILTGNFSKATDIFATGVVLYILLCGYPPFYSKSIRQTFVRTVRGVYKLEGPEWDSISDEAKDLVKKMLAMNPAERITTTEILEHPWIKSTVKDQSQRSRSDTSKEIHNVTHHPLPIYSSMEFYDNYIPEIMKDDECDISNQIEYSSTVMMETASVIKQVDDATNPADLITDENDTPEVVITRPKRKVTFAPSILSSSHSRSINLTMALSFMNEYVQDRQSQKMAATVSKFLTMSLCGSQGAQSELIDVCLIPLRKENNGSFEGNHEEVPIRDRIQYFNHLDQDMRQALSKALLIFYLQDYEHADLAAIQQHERNQKLSIEQWMNIKRLFGFSPPTPPGHPEVNTGELHVLKMIDRDGDGYLSVEDILYSFFMVEQRHEAFLHSIFRIYVEALNYPGRNINYINTVRILFHNQSVSTYGDDAQESYDSDSSFHGVDTTFKQINSIAVDSMMSNLPYTPVAKKSAKLDIVEPPRYITSDHIVAIFERFGYDPEAGVKAFNLLCDALQILKQSRNKVSPKKQQTNSSGASNHLETLQEQQFDSNDSDDEYTEATVSNSSDDESTSNEFNKCLIDSDSSDSDEEENARSDPAARKKQNRMDMSDFIETVKIDDVLLQIFVHQMSVSLYDVLIAAEEEYSARQQVTQMDESTEEKLSTVVLENILIEKLRLRYSTQK